MEKFHYFLYGKKFTLETNQELLVSIYKKHIIDISPRVQRLIVRSFPYLPFKVVIGVAKKLMDKGGKERKPWISGLFDYRVMPQSGSIASPLQLMTQSTPREKNLPQLPSSLVVPEMHQTCQTLIKRQGSNSKPERKYQELLPGTPVWVQHRQNATWEPAIVVNQCAPNSYWIMQENVAEQPKVYRCTRTMLKIRSTLTDGEQKAQMKEWSTETQNIKSHIPAIPYGNRDCDQEFSKTFSIQQCETTTAHIRSSGI